MLIFLAFSALLLAVQDAAPIASLTASWPSLPIILVRRLQPPVVPLGLPMMLWPKENPYSAEKAALGRMLYFDRRLSSDGSVSCASCHIPEHGYAEGKDVSEGIAGRRGDRNAPTVLNSGYLPELFWDGRARSLEEQCKGPIGNNKEMTLDEDHFMAHHHCQRRVFAIAGYRTLFGQIFGDDSCSIDNIAKAIATFERTLVSGEAPLDRHLHGDATALTSLQRQGYEVFLREGCNSCHSAPLYGGEGYANIGIGMDKAIPDRGRYDVDGDIASYGAFKIPSLRDVALTPPYMHDGSIATLEAVVDYYDSGGIENPHLDKAMRPLHLSAEDKAALVAFLYALNGVGWQHVTPPTSFPE